MVETEPSRPRETLPTVQFGGGPIMLWGHGPVPVLGVSLKLRVAWIPVNEGPEYLQPESRLSLEATGSL